MIQPTTFGEKLLGDRGWDTYLEILHPYGCSTGSCLRLPVKQRLGILCLMFSTGRNLRIGNY